MAYVYIDEHAQTLDGGPGGSGLMVLSVPPEASQRVEITAARLLSTALLSTTRVVNVLFDADCHVAWGTNPTTSTSQMKYRAGERVCFYVQPGYLMGVIQA
jgi:hypothetical protein